MTRGVPARDIKAAKKSMERETRDVDVGIQADFGYGCERRPIGIDIKGQCREIKGRAFGHKSRGGPVDFDRGAFR